MNDANTSVRCLIYWITALAMFFGTVSAGQSQQIHQEAHQSAKRFADRGYRKYREEWFYRGRVVHGIPSAELRRRANEAKLNLRKQRSAISQATGLVSLSDGSWTSLGPNPLCSDSTCSVNQVYGWVAGRATAVAIDPADASGNTVYIGGAQGGIWRSTDAANSDPTSVQWNAITDNQATLSIGSIAIQPGNTDVTKSVILAATGEANDSADSYFGLGILRSADGGNTWSLIGSANGGYSFAGLGGTRMAFSTASSQTSTVVSAMAISSEGVTSGKVTLATTPGLYTSSDAGLTWTYDTLTDPGGATDATSATAVVYDDVAKEFLAAVRYHGFYSSSDGVTWTRLANQPGGAVLSTASCPATSTTNGRTCPIFRGELASVPGRNEIYAWYISLDQTGDAVDEYLWQSMDGGNSWTSISDTGITNCGDSFGCGVEGGDYNLELLAVPNGGGTDVYAGAVNLYKCTITSQNRTCGSSPFMNLTHVYGCDPIAAPSHVHPDQHALASMIPNQGNASQGELLYYANDGGIYRTLNGFTGLNSGVCSQTNEFEDLNEDLGSMAQFVSFSEHPSDPEILLGGTQGNGSPATDQATVNTTWGNVLAGDGGYNAIDPLVTSNFYASNPDVPPEGLGIQLCPNGVTCNTDAFDFVVTSSSLGGDDGAFNFPFILDPGSATGMLVGTCRIWRGPRAGGTYTVLSPNFDTLGSGGCLGNEINQVRAIAAAGTPDSNGSSIIYATTSGLGPSNGPLNTPSGGHVWVTTNASSGSTSFTDVTGNGSQGSINPNQFPISGVATDSSDPSGKSAYVTIMGFTGGPGHVWQTTNAGANWIDFTGNLPDSPANAVIVYPAMQEVFVATDVGVFGSSTSSPAWTELGPNPTTDLPGYLPNVAVTALNIYQNGNDQRLRASTYGRGVWEFNLVITPIFDLAITNSPLTIFAEETGSLTGTMTALNGYTNSVTLSCGAGAPNTCSPSPVSFVPGNKTPFTVKVGGNAGDYTFDVTGTGSDANHLTSSANVTLHIIDYGITPPSPSSVSVSPGGTTPTVSFNVTASGSFNQSVNLSCTTNIVGGTCFLNPGNTVYPTSATSATVTATVDVPASTPNGTYTVNLQASTAGAPSNLNTSFSVSVSATPDFGLNQPSPFPNVKVGSTGTTGAIAIASQDGFAGTVTLNCPATYGAASCSINPTTVSSFPASANLTINGTSFVAGSYSIPITGTSGSIVHSLSIAFDVGDYSISGPQKLSSVPGGQAQATFKLTSIDSYAGTISATCDASAVPGTVCSVSAGGSVVLAGNSTENLIASLNIPKTAAPGTYNIKINTEDASGAPSHSLAFALTIGQDFVVTSSTSTQTVVAGQTSGAYDLTVQPVGTSFAGAVTLSCTNGLPAGAQCIFNPSTPVTPGSSAVDVVMSISTANSSKGAENGRLRNLLIASFTLFLPALLVIGAAPRKQRKRSVSLLLAIFLVALFSSCAGVSSNGDGTGGSGSGNPVNYQVTVTGTSPGTAPDSGQSTVITLVVD